MLKSWHIQESNLELCCSRAEILDIKVLALLINPPWVGVFGAVGKICAF